MTEQILKKYRAQSSQNVQLPYLPQTIPLRQDIKQNSSKNRQFDLRTSNSVLPKYDPLKDKNLKSFFQKTTVKKHLQHLPPPRRTSSKTMVGEKYQNNNGQVELEHSRGKKDKGQLMQNKSSGRIVTKQNFLKYIEEVRQRIKSNRK